MDGATARTSGVSAAQGIEKFDVEAVNAAERRGFYKAREPIYPKRVHGTYRSLKWFLLYLTLGVYYLLPWVRWPRGVNEPDQAILVDFEGRRFYFFFIELWPDELYFLTGLLIIAALCLFLATALFGRVWCGYACPQTVWTDLYLGVERLIEGSRNDRMKLAKAPWTFDKIRKKVVKHAAWIFIGMATGGAWIFYFHDAPTVLPQLFTGEAPATAYIFLVLLTFTTYIFAGSMREQVCTYMCPWPRIQAALTDHDTLQVTYKHDRGEPRAPHKKGDSWEGRGDCITCRACVAACPMGIDIRQGAQLECINCALCIDACDEIMAKVGRPLGLIGYDTDANIEHRMKGEAPRVRFARPRTLFYGGVLVFVAAVMTFSLASRSTLKLNLLRDRTPPYVKLSDGSVRNAYTAKIVNRDNVMRPLTLTIDGPDAVQLSAIGEDADGNSITIDAAGDAVRSLRFFVTLPPEALAQPSIPISVRLADPATGEAIVNPSVFLSEGG